MSLGILLDMAVAGHGDRVALGSPDAAAGGITFSQLARLVAGGGGVLSSQHAGRAVMLARNGNILPHLLFAAAHAGIPFIPLNYRAGVDQIRLQVSALDSAFVIADREYAHIIEGIAPSMSTQEFVTASATTNVSDAAVVEESQPAVLLFTSGTTSRPKIVPLRHENLQSYVFNTVEFSSADAEDAALVSVPPYHVAAIGSALSNIYAGRRVVHLPDFAPDRWLQLVREQEITAAMLVPTMLSRIVEHLAGAKADTPSLRLISYGGARMPRTVIERALAAFPRVGFVNAYGLTETSSTITLLGPEDHRAGLGASDESVRSRLASAGRPVPGIELQIRDDVGRALDPGEVGELWVRGLQVAGEYLGVGSVLDTEGWFPTMDRARLDAAGYLFIKGRSDDTIIRGGENIAPAEIEDVLIDHPGVEDAAVVGIEDDEWGQRLVAVVVRRAGAQVDVDTLKDHVRTHLRGSRTPDEVVFRPELPHTQTGKLMRREVARDIARSK